MSENEATLINGINMGKQVMKDQIIEMFEEMKSDDPTDTAYSLSNIIMIDEAINAVRAMGEDAETKNA